MPEYVVASPGSWAGWRIVADSPKNAADRIVCQDRESLRPRADGAAKPTFLDLLLWAGMEAETKGKPEPAIEDLVAPPPLANGKGSVQCLNTS